jgi:hypothetical protein
MQDRCSRGEPPENVTYPGPAEPLRRVWIALRAFGPTVLETVTLADIVSGELWLLGRTPPSSGDSRPGLASCGPGRAGSARPGLCPIGF